MEPKRENNFQRQVAVKTTIQEILKSPVVQDDPTQPFYLQSAGKKMYRVNVLGIVVHKEVLGSITNFQIDDGTGKIIGRFFEENKVAKELWPGTAILIIGKIRLYNEEKYLSPEIVKKMSPLWLKLRAIELKEEYRAAQAKVDQETIKEIESLKEVTEENIELPVHKLAQLIKDLDKGEGATIEEIVEKSHLKETEQLIHKMLEKGDIFQITPGKVKVL